MSRYILFTNCPQAIKSFFLSFSLFCFAKVTNHVCVQAMFLAFIFMQLYLFKFNQDFVLCKVLSTQFRSNKNFNCIFETWDQPTTTYKRAKTGLYYISFHTFQHNLEAKICLNGLFYKKALLVKGRQEIINYLYKKIMYMTLNYFCLILFQIRKSY